MNLSCFLPNRVQTITLAAMLLLPTGLGTWAATVEPGTGYTNDFSSLPAAADWATYSRNGAAADNYTMDTDVNGNLSASLFTTQLAADTANPPAKNASATYSSTGKYLQTRPTGNRYSAFMGKFVNNTGTNATQISISYLFTIVSGATEEIGTKVYFSTSGLTNSWTNLATLGSTAASLSATRYSTNLTLNWTNGGTLYLLWTDDNANGTGDDAANQISNFALQVTAGERDATVLTCFLNTPTNQAVYVTGTPITFASAVVRGTPPYAVQYYTNSGADNLTFKGAGGSATAPYNLVVSNLAAGIYNVFAVGSDSSEDGDYVFSVTNTFYVADPLAALITNPTNSSQGDYQNPISATAAITGGTAPFRIQFYLDDQPHGASETNAPYIHSFGLLPVGEHSLQVAVLDANGWRATSPPVALTINGPLAVILTPTNNSTYYYGQSLNLTATVGGGSAPYQVTFFTNGTLAGTVTASPFATNLGLLPPGAYVAQASATDSSPTTEQAFSTTNTITILENPLLTSLTSPTNGQSPSAGVSLTVAASASVFAPLVVRSVEFFVDGTSIGSDTNAPYAATLTNPSQGNHSFCAIATDSLGRKASTATNTITFAQNPLANDNFANRIVLTGPAASTTGANAGATTESGEPASQGFFTRWGSTLWWSWTAPASGPAQIDTLGSSFNTMLGIYTGTAVNSLTTVVQNDNGTGQASASIATFTAVQGTEYQIQVGGVQGFGPGGGTIATGAIKLNIGMPPSVTITSPTNNSVLLTGTPIDVLAGATSVVGTVTKVDFYLQGKLAGTASQAPYRMQITNAASGSNTLFAVITDSTSQVVTSAQVRVLVADYGVTLTAPAADATFANTKAIAIAAYALVTNSTMAGVTFLADDAAIATDTNSPFSVSWTNVTSGIHKLTAIGIDSAGLSYTSAPVLIAVARQLMPTGSVWKYFDAGTDLGTAWVAPGYDDSAWLSGPGQLGYGDGDEATVINGGSSGSYYITTYFRRQLLVTNAAAYTNLVFNVLRDDGAVVYLNGVEMARFNMDAGTVNYLTTTPNASDDGTNWWPVTVAVTNLVEGTNTLAVELHQTSSTSSDTSFDMEVLGLQAIPHNKLPLVALDLPATNLSITTPAAICLAATASDADGTVVRVEFTANGIQIGEATNTPYSMVWSNVPAGVYRLAATAVDDQGGQTTTASITAAIFDVSTTTWVAYNDHAAGAGTHANATRYDVFGTLGNPTQGFLKDIQTGTWTPATLAVQGYLAQAGNQAAAPAAGTPAHALFHSFVDFAGGSQPSIQILPDGYVTHTFTGLNPHRFYRLRASAIGGSASAANVWTRFTLIGATASAAAHTTNVLAGPYGTLGAEEAAMNTGDNRTGDVVGWDGIVPGANGTIQLKSTRYLGLAPGNLRPAQFTLAPVAIRLEEIGPLPMTWLTAPQAGYVVEGPTNIAMKAEAYGLDGIARVEFLGNGTPVATATAYPFSAVWTNAPFGVDEIKAVAYDLGGSRATSAAISITITVPPTNTIAPYLFSTTPAAYATVTNLTSVVVLFSQRVVGVDAGDLLINGLPATNVTSSASGTNYTFTFPQPAYGTVHFTWSSNAAIHDLSWPQNLPFYDVNPDNYWDVSLVDRTAPTLIAKTPAASVTVTNLTQITVQFSEPVAGVDASDLLVNNVPAYAVSGDGSNFVFAISQPASGTINVTWASTHGITDLATTPNKFSTLVSGSTWSFTLDARTILIQSNSLWLFIKGTNEASIPTNAWRMADFDDSGWSNAPAPFFYGDPYSNGIPAYTQLSDMRSNYSSIYLRKPFVVSSVSGMTNLYLYAQIDDGMIVWINGTEVLRTNVAAGEIPYNGTAAGYTVNDQNGVAYVRYTLPDPRTYLVPGTNLIAIHALNESLSNSSDFGFNAQLFTYLRDTEAVAPYVAAKTPTPGYLFELTNLVVAFSEPVTNVDAADLLINGNPATAMTSVSNRVFTFTFPQPPFGAVAVSWVTNHDILDLDVVAKPFDRTGLGSTWQYTLLNPDSPYLASVVPSQSATVSNLTQIALTFSEKVTGVDAADLLVNGVPASGLTGDGTNYIFTFAQPAYGDVAITWATNHGIADLAAPPQTFDTSWPGHTWTYTLADLTSPYVLAQVPAAGALVSNLTQLTVTFSEAVTGVNASDLLLSGKPATGVTGSNSTYTFTFAQPNTTNIVVTWAANHGIVDKASTPNAFNAAAAGATWNYATYDNVAPTLAGITPAPGATVRSLKQVSLTFDEPVQGILAGSLTVNGQAAASIEGAGAGPYTLAFEQPPTGTVQIALSSAAINDLAVPANLFRGSNWTYILDTNIPPPTITRGPYLQVRTTNSIIVRWRTSTATDSGVRFGLSAAKLDQSAGDLASTTEHIVTLSNLQPFTRYYYAIGTTDGGVQGSTNFYFTTAPLPGQQDSTRIFFISDYGFKDSGEASVRDAFFNYVMPERQPDVWITGGDNDQTSGTDAYYSTAVFGAAYAYSNLLCRVPLTPTFGNHDYQTSSGQAYFANFTMPTNGEAGGVPSGTKNYYSFNYNNIHFISLDAIVGSASSSTNSAMAQWLVQDLASNTQRWTVAYWHGPAYTKGSHDSDSTSDTLSWMVQMRQNILPILEAYSVDLVLNGHSHVYERSWMLKGHYGFSSTFSDSLKMDGGDGKLDGNGAYLKPKAGGDGTVYVTAAIGGQPQDHLTGTKHPAHLLKVSGTYGCLVIDVAGDRLNFKCMKTDGTALDYFTISKETMLPPAAPTGLTAFQASSTQVQLSWDNVATNEMRYLMERSVDGIHFTQITSVGANLTTCLDSDAGSVAPATTWYYRMRAVNNGGYSPYSETIVVGDAVAPMIAENPVSVTTNIGSQVTFRVTAVGSATLTYQWYHNAQPIQDGTSRQLVLSNVQAADAGQYSVTVSNHLGGVASSSASLVLGKVVSLAVSASAGASLYLAWPSDSEGFILEYTDVLGSGANWQPMANGILTNGGLKSLNFVPPTDRRSGYFRLRKP